MSTCCESIFVQRECMFVFVFCPLFCLFVWVDYSLFPFLDKKKPCALDTVKMIFIFLFRVEPCCAGLFSLSFSLRSLVLFLGDEKKKVFCFIPLYKLLYAFH